MELSRYLLTRGSSRCLLQGMTHAGSSKLYQFLQLQLDQAVSEGAVVFREGLLGNWRDFVPSDGEEFACSFLQGYFRAMEMMVQSMRVTHQREGIVYPKDSVPADISFGELVKGFVSLGIVIPERYKVLATYSDEQLQEMYKGFGSGSRSLNQKLGHIRSNPDELALALRPLTLTLRSLFLVKRLETWFEEESDRYAFVHYGQNHIEETVAMLTEKGWVVKEVSQLDVVTFCE